MSRRRAIGLGVCAVALADLPSSLAQTAGIRHLRLGFIGPGPGIEADEEAFRECLRELGHIEGRDLSIEWRFAKGDPSRFLPFAQELIGMRSQIQREALKRRLPVMATHAAFATEGALMSYAADIVVVKRTATEYVDRIHKGARPADLPIDQPKRYERVLNRRTVESLGLKLSQTLLARVDRVVG